MTARLFLVLAALVVVLTACGPAEPDMAAPERERPLVATTFFPTTWMVRRLAAEHVDVELPVEADADPIFWKPTPEGLRTFQTADLVVVNGADFERWVGTVSLPSRRVVDTAAGFDDQFIRFRSGVAHSHGPSGEHVHEGIDGHTWLAPSLAKQQAAAVADALAELVPAAAESIRSRLPELEAELDALATEIAAIEQPEGTYFYASHPAYNYLAREAGWRVVNLDLDPESMPSDEEFAAIAAQLENQSATLLLWESEPLPEIAARVQDELGLTSVVFSPSEMVDAPLEADYVALQRENLTRLRAALE